MRKAEINAQRPGGARISSCPEEAAAVLRNGGVIVCPAESVYGLSCDARDAAAVERIIALKRRSREKGLILVDADWRFVRQHADLERLDALDLSLLIRSWPGPHTFVLPCRGSFAGPAVRADRTLAIRLTAFEPLRRLCARVGGPLISTSANLAGESPAGSVGALSPEIAAGVDLILDLPCGGLPAPSSIYEVLTHKLLRRGPDFKEIV